MPLGVSRIFKMLLGAGVAPSSIYVYILERPGEEEDALKRVQAAARFEVRPYVLPLNDYVDTGLRRWTNRRYYQFVDWQDYSRRREPQAMLPL